MKLAQPMVNADAEFEASTSLLQMYLTKVLNRAFPAGIYGAKGKAVETVGQNEDGCYAGQFFLVYDRYLDKNLTVEFTLFESLKLSVTHQEPEGYCAEDMALIVDGVKASWDWQRDETNPAEISLHSVLQKISELIGAKGFGKKKPNRHGAYYTYKAMGKGGRVCVRHNTDKNEYTIHYRSGTTSSTTHLPVLLSDDSAYTRAQFFNELERNAKINLVWHTGASQLVQKLIDAVPVHTFRHHLLLRPSYHYDVPFCDFVLEKYPDVIVLRAHHDGYQFWRGGVFVKGVQSVEEIIAEPLTEEIVVKYPQRLWQYGTGLLYTSGELMDTEIEGHRHVKFVPFKRD